MTFQCDKWGRLFYFCYSEGAERPKNPEKMRSFDLRSQDDVRGKRVCPIYFIYLWLMFLSLLTAGCSTLPARIDVGALPKADEKNSSYDEEKIGLTGFYYIQGAFKIVDDPVTVNRLSRLGVRIAHYTERPHIHYKFYILDSKYRNAFSFPDGYIFFTNSYINTLKTDEHLAAVMAHEIAHVTHKHALTEYQRRKNYNPLADILGINIFLVALDTAHDQACELQADQTGLHYLYRAGFNQQAMLDVMTALKLIEKEDGVMYKEDKKGKFRLPEMGLFKTHPATDRRLEALKESTAGIPNTEKVLYNPKDFNF